MMNVDPLNATLHDASELLKVQGIAFALIGGLAVAVRGEPRSTLDVDIIIDCDVERALHLVTQLDDSNFRPLFEGVEQIVKTGLLLPLVHRQFGIKVDIAIGMSGFEQDAIRQATMTAIGASNIPVVRSEYLIVMKQLAARPRDIDDIAKIFIRQGKHLDWNLTTRLASQLGEAVSDDLLGPLTELRNRSLSG
jgi:predicted nucleotidyltransferase